MIANRSVMLSLASGFGKNAYLITGVAFYFPCIHCNAHLLIYMFSVLLEQLLKYLTSERVYDIFQVKTAFAI